MSFQSTAFQNDTFQAPGAIVNPFAAFQDTAFQGTAFQGGGTGFPIPPIEFTRNDQPYKTILYNTDQFLDPARDGWGVWQQPGTSFGKEVFAETYHDDGSPTFTSPHTGLTYTKVRIYNGQSGGYISYWIKWQAGPQVIPPPPPPPPPPPVGPDTSSIPWFEGPEKLVRKVYALNVGWIQTIGFLGGPPPAPIGFIHVRASQTVMQVLRTVSHT